MAAVAICTAPTVLQADNEVVRQSEELPALPAAVTNNAVASVKAGRREYVVSFNGLAEGKTHEDTLASTYVYDSRSKSWSLCR